MNNKTKKVKIKEVVYTPEQFSEKYGYLEEKYGPDYMDVVCEDLLNEGIKVVWDYES